MAQTTVYAASERQWPIREDLGIFEENRGALLAAVWDFPRALRPQSLIRLRLTFSLLHSPREALNTL